MKNEVPIKIIGERIYLRELTLADVTEEYCDWLNDPEVNKYLETRHITLDELKRYVQKQIDNPDSFFVGIFDKSDDKHIGNVKLEPIDWDKKTAMFGIVIGDKKYWGKGLGAEAMRLIIDYAFNKFNLKEIRGGVFSKNKSAVKLYKKIGFRVVSIKKNATNRNGELYDDIYVAIKNEKYPHRAL